MAAAFRILGQPSKVKVADRFGAVFQAHIPLDERKFPKGAWYQQQSCWDLCRQEERDAAAQLPRTSDGLSEMSMRPMNKLTTSRSMYWCSPT
jgi:hypothetical protein